MQDPSIQSTYYVEHSTIAKLSPGPIGRSLKSPDFIRVWHAWPLTSGYPWKENSWGCFWLKVRPAQSSLLFTGGNIFPASFHHVVQFSYLQSRGVSQLIGNSGSCGEGCRHGLCMVPSHSRHSLSIGCQRTLHKCWVPGSVQ